MVKAARLQGGGGGKRSLVLYPSCGEGAEVRCENMMAYGMSARSHRCTLQLCSLKSVKDLHEPHGR
jgi:hypothetical protein